jgi:hypothetical protein
MDRLPFWNRSRLLAATAVFGLATALTAGCGDQGGTESEGPGAQGPPVGSEEDATLEVTTPAESATVTVPFEVSVDSTMELGAMSAELHHLHIWFGDTSGQPLIIESGTTMIDDAPNGDTTMIVQVHTFEHVPASDQVSVPLVVQGGSDSEGTRRPPGNDY